MGHCYGREDAAVNFFMGLGLLIIFFILAFSETIYLFPARWKAIYFLIWAKWETIYPPQMSVGCFILIWPWKSASLGGTQ